LRTGNCLVTHNGTILNADYLFHRFGFGRHAQVDSEIIGRIADASIVGGRIDMRALRERLTLCRGQMSAVIVAKTDPETVVILKGNKPLELIYHPKLHAVFYASSAKYLQAALSDAKGWKRRPIEPMRISVFPCSDLQGFQLQPFSFVAQTRGSLLKGGVPV